MPVNSVSMVVNGQTVEKEVSTKTLLVTFLRESLGLTGTHIGCDTSQCGACNVHVNGKCVKSCTILAVQVDGSDVVTIEGVANDGELNPMQEAFKSNHALQCGFCTPGMVMTALQLAKQNSSPNEKDIRKYLEGNFCRCTGYHNIVKAISEGTKAINSS